jgi:hypothetical protein
MEIEELLKTAGISKDDLKAFIGPLIKEAIGEELKGEIQNTIKEEVRPVIEALPGQVNAFVTQQVEKLADEVKSKTDERLEKVVEAAKGKPGNNTSKGKTEEISPELKEKLLNKFIDKALGSDEEGLTKGVEKLAKLEQVKATLMQSLGIYQPGPEIIWKAYQDATAKAYAAMMKGGKMPFPIVDETVKKNLSPSSQVKQSKVASSKKSSRPFDRFLR